MPELPADLYESEIIAEMYDGDYAALRTPVGDVDFYVAKARAAGGPVLELGCGTGRILVPTARAGVPITGIDGSARMLARARKNLGDVRARLVEADICEADLGERFALVTIPFRVIAHIPEVSRQLRLFSRVRDHLRPGGQLVFDFFQPDPASLAAPTPEKLHIERMEGTTRIRRYGSQRPRLSGQVTDVTFRWEIEAVGAPRREVATSFAMRWYHRFELEHLLARCGLEIVSLHGDFRGGAFLDTSKEMVFVARAC